MHIVKRNNGSEDWHTPYAENDLTEGGKFITTMAAKDGCMSFDFEGKYTSIKQNEAIEYVMADGRKVQIRFVTSPNGVEIIESFELETENPENLQQQGWQTILDNFRKYVEII